MAGEVIWATSTTGEDFQCVHHDDWRIAQERIAKLEAALRALLDANLLEGTATKLTEEQWAEIVGNAIALVGEPATEA